MKNWNELKNEMEDVEDRLQNLEDEVEEGVLATEHRKELSALMRKSKRIANILQKVVFSLSLLQTRDGTIRRSKEIQKKVKPELEKIKSIRKSLEKLYYGVKD